MRQNNPDGHRHWPVFAKPLCGEVSDRDRLGLPDRYLPSALDEDQKKWFSDLRHESLSELLRILPSAQLPLAGRLVAGNLLGALGDPRIRTDQPDMISIEGGRVEIGLAKTQVEEIMREYQGLGLEKEWIEKECPRFQTQLRPYGLARYPVTNEEFRIFLIDTGYPEIPTSWTFRRFPAERSNHPVYTVSAEAADTYASWLATRTGRAFRLPSEAEWEWAAAGPEGREFPWGDTFAPDLANTAETGLFTTSPVGVFVGGESVFGISDLAGNVEEYVADEYGPYPEGTFIADHLVKIQGRYRVARGGSFARFRDLARTRRRHGHNPKSTTYAMGFRLAESH